MVLMLLCYNIYINGMSLTVQIFMISLNVKNCKTLTEIYIFQCIFVTYTDMATYFLLSSNMMLSNNSDGRTG